MSTTISMLQIARKAADFFQDDDAIISTLVDVLDYLKATISLTLPMTEVGVIKRAENMYLRSARPRDPLHQKAISALFEQLTPAYSDYRGQAKRNSERHQSNADFAVDSSGFSTTNYVRWFDVKYGNTEDWHEWIKMHIACGVKTHVVTAVELTSARRHDAPYLKPLLAQTAQAGFKMQEVSADKGYISGDNLQAVVDHGATPLRALQNKRDGKARHRTLEKDVFTITVSSAKNS